MRRIGPSCWDKISSLIRYSPPCPSWRVVWHPAWPLVQVNRSPDDPRASEGKSGIGVATWKDNPRMSLRSCGLRFPPPHFLLAFDLRARLGAPQVPGASPGAGRGLAAAGGGHFLLVEIDDLAVRSGDQHRLHLQLGGKLEIDATHHRDHRAFADHDRSVPAHQRGGLARQHLGERSAEMRRLDDEIAAFLEVADLEGRDALAD